MVQAILTVVILVIIVAESAVIINPRGPTVVLDFTICIKNIVEKHFNEPGVLIFANHNNASSSVSRIKAELLTRIHQTATYTVEIKTPEHEIDVCDNYDEKLGILHRDIFEPRPLGAYYIIIVDSYSDFPPLVSRLLRTRSWDPSAKFIILLFNFAAKKVNELLVEKILSCFFKYNVINIAVIVPHESNVRNAIIYGWRPYDPPNFCGYCNETAHNRLFVENACEKGTLKNKNSIFGDRVPRNMDGCVLYVIALEREPFVSSNPNDANIEKVLTNEVLRRYNLKASYTIINSSRGEREDDGQWNGALRHLTMKKGQVLLGGIFPDFDVHEDFECSFPYLADSYTWVVPRADPSHPWIALVVMFQRFVWYSVIGGFITCALFWTLLGEISHDTTRNRSFRHCFLNAWICSLGYCSYLRPTQSSLRLFFVFFNIYCMMIVTAYQTKLIDVLKNPLFDYQIQTIEELVESGLKFGGIEELHDLFINSSDPFDSYIYDNWIDVTDIYQAIIDVTVHRNFSLLCSRLELAHVSAVVPDLSDDFGNLKYYTFQMNMFSVPMEMVALRGFGLMSKISEGLSLFKQAGIGEAIRQNFVALSNRQRARLLRLLHQEKYDVNSLSLKHLQGGFLALALGYFTGAIALSLEIISNSEFVRRKLARFSDKFSKSIFRRRYI